MTNFEEVLRFLAQNRENKFINFRLKESGLKIEQIKKYDDFKKIKPITRKELSELSRDVGNFAKFFDKCPLKIFESPGPIYNFFMENYFQYRFYKALEYSSFGHCDIVINTFSYHLTPAGEMFDEAVRNIGATVIPLGPCPSSKCAEVIKNTGATAFIGTKSYLKNVLNELGSKNSLLKAYLIAEKITNEERKELGQKYNIEIYQGYGTAEVGLIATECEYKDGMHLDNEIFLEVIDPNTGKNVKDNEIGEAVVTLLNKNYPLLRYSTGDLVSYTGEKCRCEKESLRILGVFGRTDSSVKVRGVFIHGWNFEDFCKKMGVNCRLEIVNDENNKDFLIAYLNKDVENFKEKFKDFLKLTLNDIILDDKIDKSEIIEKRTYFKKR
ncbi:MAG: hypothetical protein PWQ25_776 [Deferribacteres bacterium]|jgi:phenylacetate-CoA ligase|nr:phenylacetate-CoA ligase [Deferribacteraceae bacterium]MDK2791913.1 hypothetical protein [Deferribacteres bacterium]